MNLLFKKKKNVYLDYDAENALIIVTDLATINISGILDGRGQPSDAD